MSAYSSRIEKLQVYPDRTQFDLDGNSVHLTEENAGPALKAFQEFYAAAWEAYATRPALTQPPAKPGFWKTAAQALRPSSIWQNIKSLLSRLFEPDPQRQPPPVLSPIGEPASPSTSSRVAPAASESISQPDPIAPPLGSVPLERRAATSRPSVRSRLSAAPSGPAASQPGSDSAGRRAAGAAPTATAAADVPPVLSAFAEHEPISKSSPSRFAGTPPVLSTTAESVPPQKNTVAPPLGPRPALRSAASTGLPEDHFHLLLRSAYADEHGVHLLWMAGEAGKEKQTEMLCSFESPVAERLQHCYSRLSDMGHPVVDLRVWRPQPDPSQPLIAATVTAPSAKKLDPGAVMKLQPGPSDTPGRAVVAPVSDSKALQVLTAPERLIDALHSASDPSTPEAERLTYLRCASGRAGLKVLAVGTGENAEAPGTPAHWENISTWWEAHKHAASPTPPASTKTPSTEPAPELF